jgi:repressor LexA
MGRTKATEISQKQLQAIRLCIRVSGFPPTMQELAACLGISHSSVHEQVALLVRKGFLRKENNKARGIVVNKVLKVKPESGAPHGTC